MPKPNREVRNFKSAKQVRESAKHYLAAGYHIVSLDEDVRVPCCFITLVLESDAERVTLAWSR